jgi:hypothetical protein
MADREIRIRTDLLPSFNEMVESKERSPFRAGLTRLGAELRYNLPMAAEKAIGTLSPEDVQYYQSGLRRGAARAEELAPGGPMGISQVGSVGDIGTLVKENIAYSLPQMATSLGGAIVGAVKGGPRGAIAGAIAGGTPGFIGANISRATDDGTSELTGKEVARSALMAPLQSASDVLVERYLPGAGKIFGGMAATQTAKSFTRRTLQSVSKAALTEATTEAGQQVAERYAAGLPLTSKDAASEYVQAFGTAFFTGGAMGGLGGFRKNPLQNVDPATTPTEDLAEVVDGALGRGEPAPAKQLLLPAPAPPIAYSDAGGRTVVGDDGIEQILAAPVEPPRPLKDVSDEELVKVASNVSGVEPSIVEAVQRELNLRRGATEQNSDGPASTTISWTDQRDTLLKGVNSRGRYVDATDENDLKTRVLAELEAGSTRKGDFKLAERLGIDLNATAAEPVSRETIPEPAAPANLEGGDTSADPEFQTRWQESLKGTRDPALRALNPLNEEDLDRKLYQAMGGERFGEGTTWVQGESDRSDVERLAQLRGLITEEGALTPKALQYAAEGVTIPMQDSVRAAMKQGFKGEAASVFDRGAQDLLSGKRPQPLKDFKDIKAYQAGQQWASEQIVPPTATAAQSQDTMQNLQVAGQSPDMPVGADLQMRLNQAVDQMFSERTHPGENAQLKRMIAEGATTEELDATADQLREADRFKGDEARYYKTGHGALAHAAPKTDYKGDVVTRGLKNAAGVEALLRGGRDAAAARKAEQRANEGQTQELIARQQRREVIKARLMEIAEEIDEEMDARVPEIRVDKNGVITNRNAEVLSEPERTVFDRINEQMAIIGTMADSHYDLKTPSGRWKAAADALIKHAPGSSQRLLANRIKEASERMMRQGWRFDFLLAGQGEPAPMPIFYGARGVAALEMEQTVVWLNDRQPGNWNYIVMAHEMLHAVTQAALHYGEHMSSRSVIGKATQDLMEVTKFIQAHFNNLRRTEMNAFHHEIARGANNALENHFEIVAWGLTDTRMQEYLASIEYTPGKSMWERFVEAVLRLFGLSDKHHNALAEVMRVTKIAMDHHPSWGEAQSILDELDALDEPMSPLQNPMMQLGIRGEVDKANERAGAAIKKVTAQADQMVRENGVRGAIRRGALAWASVHDIAEHFGKWFEQPDKANPVTGYEKALDSKHAITARMALLFTDIRDAYQQLEKKSAEATMRLTTLTEHGINPTKPWADQLESVRDNPNLKAMHAEAHALYRSLSAKGHAKVYNDLRTYNDLQMMAQWSVTLHHQVARDRLTEGKIAQFAEDPMDRFMAEQAKHGFDLDQSREYWAKELRDQIGELKAYLKAAGYATDPKYGAYIDPLVKRMARIEQGVKLLEQVPYFHLGRYGDYFVNFNVNPDDATAMAKIADHMADKGFGVIISKESDRGNVYIRVENQATQARLAAEVRKLQAAKLVAGGEKDIKVGKRTEESLRNSFADEWFDRLAEDIKASKDLSDEAKAHMIESLQHLHLDLMPENSLSRVLTERKSIPGYSADMMRNIEWRAQVGTNALAGYVTAPKISRAFSDMRVATENAQYAAGQGRVTPNQANGMQEVVDELSKHEAERPLWPETTILDQLRAINHFWFLGFSVSYGAVNLTQLAATVLPELGARHGFVKTSKTLAEVTPLAFKIIKAMASGGYEVSLSRAMDAVITHSALTKVPGLDKKTIEFIMRVANTGNLDIGGASREQGRAAQGRGNSKFDVDKVLRYGSAIGYYTETASRLITALATYKLNPQLSVEAAADRAGHVIVESLWNYSQTNQGRMFGKQGFLGRLTPLTTAFMTYTAMLTGKLYRETYDAIGGATPAERREARRFLAGHLAAITALAGTLGLPLTTAFAAAFDKLQDTLFNDDEDEPSNIRADYRQFLSDMFGKDIEPILSRGLSRGVGIDISGRVGEQDIMPFSKFFADRRNFRDSIKDMQTRSWGAPASMVAGWMEGGERLADGDTMGGLIRMLPNAAQAPLKAARMDEKGFVDARGNVLPIEASVQDQLVQLFGFNPAQNADNAERRDADKITKGEMTRRAKVLRDKIVSAIIQQDPVAREYIAEAQEFDRANPNYAILPDVASALKRRAKLQITAEITQSPIGTKPGSSKYTFGDVEYRAQ